MPKRNLYCPRLKALRDEALGTIDTYTGPKAVTLSTGVRALNMDDGWLILGTGNPVLRNKRDQRLIEAGKEPSWNDQPISDLWSIQEICELADKLLALR